MAKAKHYIPDRAHAVTPYLVVHDGQAAIAWYQKVFGATWTRSWKARAAR